MIKNLLKSATGVAIIPLLVIFCTLFAGCSMLILEDDVVGLTIARTTDLLLLIDDSLFTSIESSIDQYVQDVHAQDCSVRVVRWQEGTFTDLKALIQESHSLDKIGGAFLVGNIPSAWYENEGFYGYEAFPCDVYLMDTDAAWQDNDGNGILDYHSSLELDIYVSRISGTVEELQQYFEKIHAYRNGNLAVDRSAYIFKDNAWIDFEKGSTFGLDDLYANITVYEEFPDTVKQAYMEKLTSDSAEYVYQWIHAYPPLLCIEESDLFNNIFTSEIMQHNLRGLFFNLFNCSASRFTEENIAMTCLVKTDYGLATTGTTKPGGNYYPKAFHYLLSQGNSWGEAFRGWYNHFGITSDKWFLGMVILGDPMLTISTTVHKVLKTAPLTQIPPSEEMMEELEHTLIEFTDGYGELTYEDYKEAYPQFFKHN